MSKRSCFISESPYIQKQISNLSNFLKRACILLKKRSDELCERKIFNENFEQREEGGQRENRNIKLV